jgi:hypothetical protein
MGMRIDEHNQRPEYWNNGKLEYWGKTHFR